jgi:hypothetical protein
MFLLPSGGQQNYLLKEWINRRDLGHEFLVNNKLAHLQIK